MFTIWFHHHIRIAKIKIDSGKVDEATSCSDKATLLADVFVTVIYIDTMCVYYCDIDVGR